MRTHVGIVGHRGYSGAELIRLLKKHPFFHPILLDHREDAVEGMRYRRPSAEVHAPSSGSSVEKEALAAVLLATPPEVSMAIAPVFLDAGAKVVDLSGAFRLGGPEEYRHWYKETHTQPGLLAEAVYGLPEYARDAIPGSRLVANPGCYPTAANLAIRPLVTAGAIDLTAGVVCDAKSGVSGAGRKPSLKTSFCEVTENFSAYGFLDHRHVPEVLAVSGLEERQFSFTAQLLPIHRGILETIYFRSSTLRSAADLLHIYEKQYQNEPFIRIHELGSFPDLRSVARTNFCDLGVAFHPPTGRGLIVSAIDNLGKGAAGQAVQNLNLMFRRPEAEGLL